MARRRAYRAAQLAGPSDIAAANTLAMSLMLEGRAAEAVTILAALNRRAGAPPRVAVNLGIAQALAGDAGSARTTLAGRIEDADLDNIASGFGTLRPQPAAEPRPDAMPGRG